MDEASPRFRTDLEASATEADGVACVDVTDRQTGTSFRFYDFEYQLALQLNGQPLDAVTSWAKAAYDVELTTAGLAEFAGRLAELGFLEGRPAAAPEITDMGGGPAAAAGPREITDMGAGGPTAVSAASIPPETTDMGAGEPTAVSKGSGTSEADQEGSGPETTDSPESDWTEPQAVKTASFVPDSAMLTPSLDRTPVAPDIPFLDEREPTPGPAVASAVAVGRSAGPPNTPAPELAAAPLKQPAGPEPSVAVTRPTEAPTVRLPPFERSVAVTRPAEAPTVPALPSALLGRSGSVGASAGVADGKPRAATWAADLDGTLGTDAAKGNDLHSSPAAPPTSAAGSMGTGGAPDRLGATPRGVPERRQPPKPDAVVMSGFTAEEGTGAATAANATRKGPALVVVAIALLVIVAAAVSYMVWSRSQMPEPHALRVRSVAPKPTAVYRWFSSRGVVVEDEPRALAFDGPGRLLELLPSGGEFGPGEIIGRLQGSAAIETLLAHHRSRLAFHEQMRESMRAAGNLTEARQAELKLGERQRLIAETTAALARVTLRSNEPGEVVETLAKVGTVVKPGVPVMRIKGPLLHGEFRFEADERAAAAKLAFCRVEVVGLGPHASNEAPRRPSAAVADAAPPAAQGAPRFVDCGTATGAGDKWTVALPSDVGLVPGQPLRLARERLDAVFPIPAAALDGEGDQRTVWIAGRDGVAERRPVTIAGVDGSEAYVGAGLRVGDDVIVEAPAGLLPGAAIVADR